MRKLVIIDYRTSKEEHNNFKKFGYDILLCPPCYNVHEAINGHPDIQLFKINNNNLIVQKDMDKSFLNALSYYEINYKLSKCSLEKNYPNDIILNGFLLGDYFIHLLKKSDENLLKSVNDKIKINIPQGYSKCSSLILNEKALITSDKGIYNSLKDIFDVLLIENEYIELKPFDTGFIGGCTGKLNDNTIGFLGELKYYNFEMKILSFLKKYNLEYVSLKSGFLVDRGSFFSFY